jgi:flagellar motor switch protein FliM
LAQITLPLDRILRLQAGEVLALSGAALDNIRLQGINGLPMAAGKLGQQRGMRAIRLVEAEICLPEIGTAPMMHPAAPAAPLDADDGFPVPVDFMQAG